MRISGGNVHVLVRNDFSFGSVHWASGEKCFFLWIRACVYACYLSKRASVEHVHLIVCRRLLACVPAWSCKVPLAGARMLAPVRLCTPGRLFDSMHASMPARERGHFHACGVLVRICTWCACRSLCTVRVHRMPSSSMQRSCVRSPTYTHKKHHHTPQHQQEQEQ